MWRKNTKTYNLWLSVAVMALANSSIYGIIYMRNSYYNIMRDTLRLTHVEMGNIWTVYGVVSMFSYLAGGWIADTFPLKKMIKISLIGVIGSAAVLWTKPSYEVMLLIYALFAVFAILTYYPVSMKIISYIGKEAGEGKVFGTYWTLVFVVNICVSTIGIHFVNQFQNNHEKAYSTMILVYEVILVIALVLFQRFFRLDFQAEKSQRETVYRQFQILKDKKIILISLIVFLNYIVISSFSYLTPYMLDVLKLSQSDVLLVNMIKGEILGAIVTFTIGIITDKLHSAIKVIGYASAIGAVLLVNVCLMKNNLLLSIMFIILMTVLFTGSKSVTMVTVSESKISMKNSGTAIGVISFLGYCPDAFYYIFAGRILERYGQFGYTILFAVSSVIAILCCICCCVLYKINQKEGGVKER